MTEKTTRRLIEFEGKLYEVLPLEQVTAQPGDVFVLTSPTKLTKDQAANLEARWKGCALGEFPVVVMDSGFKLAVARRENTEGAGALPPPDAPAGGGAGG